jgi:hypothetical protein
MKKVPINKFIKLATLCLYHTDSENSRALAVHMYTSVNDFDPFLTKWNHPDRKWMLTHVH